MIKGLFKKHCIKADDTQYLYVLSCKDGHLYFDNEGIPALSKQMQYIKIDCTLHPGDMFIVSGKDVALFPYAQKTCKGPVLLSIYWRKNGVSGMVDRVAIEWLPETENTLKTHFSFNTW